MGTTKKGGWPMKKITISVPDDFVLHLDFLSEYFGVPKSRLLVRRLENFYSATYDDDPDFRAYLKSIMDKGVKL